MRAKTRESASTSSMRKLYDQKAYMQRNMYTKAYTSS